MSLNKIQLIGNVGNITIKDVKGVKVANLSLATNERGFTTKSGKEVPDHTEWHKIVLWRSLASSAEEKIKVGTQIYVEGKVNSSMYTDKNGVERMSYNIVAERYQILGKQEKANTAPKPVDNFPPAEVKHQAPNVGEQVDADDDLPF